MRRTWLVGMALMGALACGDEDPAGDDGVEGFYAFFCDEEDPSCDDLSDEGMYVADGKVYRANIVPQRTFLCYLDERGTYTVTAGGLRVRFYGDDESPPSEEDATIVDGVIMSEDPDSEPAKRISGKLREGSDEECAEFD